MKKCIIKADYNDGDYIHTVSKISDEEIEHIKRIIPGIKEKNGFWPTGESSSKNENLSKIYIEPGILTEEDIEIMENFVPCGEYGIHTIESIEIVESLETLY